MAKTKKSISEIIKDMQPPNYSRNGKYSSEHELYGGDLTLKESEKEMFTCLLDTFDAVRDSLGHPLIITSGRRTIAKQRGLIAAGDRAATRSCHCYGAAIDVAVPGHMRDEDLAQLFMKYGDAVCGFMPRVGYLKYRNQRSSSEFIHIDVGPLAYFYADEPPDAWRYAGLVF